MSRFWEQHYRYQAKTTEYNITAGEKCFKTLLNDGVNGTLLNFFIHMGRISTHWFFFSSFPSEIILLQKI